MANRVVDGARSVLNHYLPDVHTHAHHICYLYERKHTHVPSNIHTVEISEIRTHFPGPMVFAIYNGDLPKHTQSCLNLYLHARDRHTILLMYVVKLNLSIF